MPAQAKRQRVRSTDDGTDSIGTSHEGRPIVVFRTGHPDAGLRVLIMGGQHGDEPIARRAVEQMAARDPNRMPRNVQMALIPDVNPDGAAAKRRRNAQGIDLNRDHLMLSTDELVALHAFVRQWQPHLILDVHTYPARRKHLLRQDLVHCHDVFLDIPTHPAIEVHGGNAVLQRGLATVVEQLTAEGIRAARYTLIRKSGRARHSTCDIVDARNQLALRYGIPTVLLEGRQVSRRHETDDARRHVRRSMVRAMELMVGRVESLESRGERREATVPVGCRFRAASDPLTMPFRRVSTGVVEPVTWSGPYTPTVKPTRPVQLPAAYAIPLANQEVIDLLRRHGFKGTRSTDATEVPSVAYRVTSAEPARRVGGPIRKVRTDRVCGLHSLRDMVIFSTQQEGGRALAVYLEPNSKYGLARFESMRLPVLAGTLYPILRCEAT